MNNRHSNATIMYKRINTEQLSFFFKKGQKVEQHVDVID